MRILEIAIVVLLVLWLGGFFLHIAGSLIHILLIAAIVLILVRVIKFIL